MKRICFVSKHDRKKRNSHLPKLNHSSGAKEPISVGIKPVSPFSAIIIYKVERQMDELEAWNEPVLF